MFNIGDLAVYPAHGVGVIEKIEPQEVSGCRQDFYVMRILDNNMIIMIPTNNVNNVGLRDIIGQTEVSKLYSILKKRDVTIDNQTWNRRYREYMEKIKTGSAFEVAEVYRDLLILKLEKDLSFGERKMLDTARNLLVKEISLARNVGEDQVEKDLDRIFS
jgi:CarD family transcriptional regulator